VPNELLVTSRVENASFADRKVLVTATLQVGYGTDVDALIPQLVACIAGIPRVLDEPPPAVLLSDFAADGLQLTLLFWIDDPENGQANVRSAVNLAVLRLLRGANITIPYPQREVRVVLPPT
jgi:small-conductance mechanosensitive channel